MDRYLTSIPKVIQKIYDKHAECAGRIVMWLYDIGCSVSGPVGWKVESGLAAVVARLKENTSISIEVCHDNDYIEMGPHTPDPKGEMFHVKTLYKEGAIFEPNSLLSVMKSLNNFAAGKCVVNNTTLKDVTLEFYSWQRKIQLADKLARNPNLSFPLVFTIHHMFPRGGK